MFDISEEKEVGWCEIMLLGWVYGEAEQTFFAKSSEFSGDVRFCVVSMNNGSSSINMRAERKKFCEKINMAVLGIKCLAFWKRVE
jgi:hypothetical protein